MNKHLKSACLWIKEYKHVLRVIGGLFFCLALFAGIFWIAGKNVEPVAYVLGLLSSVFLTSPSIAEYFLPDRKPIKNMTFEEILEFIPTTDPKEDWHGISKEWSSERFLKEDPRLRFRAKFLDEGIQNDDFKEKWANCHPDPKATGYWYELYYDGAFLDRIILVSVDGGRADIPPPEFKSGKINQYKYHVAKIHDTLNTLDEYITRSRLEVEMLRGEDAHGLARCANTSAPYGGEEEEMNDGMRNGLITAVGIILGFTANFFSAWTMAPDPWDNTDFIPLILILIGIGSLCMSLKDGLKRTVTDAGYDKAVTSAVFGVVFIFISIVSVIAVDKIKGDKQIAKIDALVEFMAQKNLLSPKDLKELEAKLKSVQ